VDEAILRIRFEGEGGGTAAAATTVSIPRPTTAIPTPPAPTPAGAPPIPSSASPSATGGAAAYQFGGEKFDAWLAKMGQLNALLDTDIVAARIYQEAELLAVQKELNDAMAAARKERDAELNQAPEMLLPDYAGEPFVRDKGPQAPVPSAPPEQRVYEESQQRLADFQEELKRLTEAMEPRRIAETALQEKALADARAELAAATEKARQALDPKPLFDPVREQWEKFDEEMERLREALDPATIERAVYMENELAYARQKVADATAAERKQTRPEGEMGPPKQAEAKSFMETLMNAILGSRGAIGGALGPLAGAGLDVAAAVQDNRKAAAAREQAGVAGATTGASGAEAALPVIGAVIGAVDAVGRSFESMATAQIDFRDALVSASTSPGEYIDSIGQTVTAFVSSIPVIGGFLGAMSEATFSLGSFMQAADAMADRYAAYSPDISVAQSMADVTQTLGDLRRAQEIGPDMAQFVNAESQLRQTFENEKIKILHALLPLATDAMKILNAAMPFIEMAIKPLLMYLELIHAFLVKMGWSQETTPDTDFDLPTVDILGATPFRFNREGVGASPVG
jgi:hypothetical protein